MPDLDSNNEATRLGYQPRSGRELTWQRRLGYRLSVSIAWCLTELIWRTARIRYVGEEHWQIARVTQAAIPVCWHQHLLICARYWVSGRSGLQHGFLISPSLDGEAPTWLAERYRAKIVRGSSTHTGSRAIRQLLKTLRRDKVSPLITPDGPKGPRFDFKPGTLFVAQHAEVPIVPLAFAAKPAKIFRTWDKFVLPSPFARIVIVVGEPLWVPKEMDAGNVGAIQAEISRRMLCSYQLAHAELHNTVAARQKIENR